MHNIVLGNLAIIANTKENRIKWFKKCLENIEKQGITRVAMPYNIGCGLAGGDWQTYKTILEESKLNIFIYKL